MSDPVRLVTNTQRVNADVVEQLETALAKAKDGQLQGVSIAGVYGDGSCYTAYSSTENVITMIGAISILLARRVATVQRVAPD